MSNDFPNRQTIRLPGYDYSGNGLYFITICTASHENLFGAIANGVMALNEYGEIVQNEIINTAKIRDNIIIDQYIIMPNHIHLIVAITPRRGVLPYARPQTSKYAPTVTVANRWCRGAGNQGCGDIEHKYYP